MREEMGQRSVKRQRGRGAGEQGARETRGTITNSNEQSTINNQQTAKLMCI